MSDFIDTNRLTKPTSNKNFNDIISISESESDTSNIKSMNLIDFCGLYNINGTKILDLLLIYILIYYVIYIYLNKSLFITFVVLFVVTFIFITKNNLKY